MIDFWSNFSLDTATFDLNKLLSDLPKELPEEENVTLKCNKCNFSSQQQANLLLHVAYVHDQTFFVCGECETRTKTEDALQFQKERRRQVLFSSPSLLRSSCLSFLFLPFLFQPPKDSHPGDVGVKQLVSNSAAEAALHSRSQLAQLHN